MTPSERRLEILEYLNEYPSTIKELADKFKVTTMTIRRDLKYFENQEIIDISNGKVKVRDGVGFEATYLTKADQNILQKRKIGEKASSIIRDGDVVYIDCGTTCKYVAEAIVKNDKQITVFTTSLLVTNVLMHARNIELYMVPGKYREKSVGFIGHLAIDFVNKLQFDIAFMGAEGLDISFGISTPNLEEVTTKKAVVNASKKFVLVTDSSKFYKKTLGSYADIDQLYCVITDNSADLEFIEFEKKGINIIYV